MICDPHLYPGIRLALAGCFTDVHAHHTARRGMADRVGEQVFQSLLQTVGIGIREELSRQRQLDPRLAAGEHVGRVAHQSRHVDRGGR